MGKIRKQKWFSLGLGAVVLLLVGSVNAADSASGENRLLLNESFRSGKNIAENSRLSTKVKKKKKYLRGDEKIIYPFNKYFNYKQGTVEFSISFTSLLEIRNKKNWTIFHASPSGSGFANTIIFTRGWGNGLFLLLGDKKGNRTIIAYPEMMTKWKINEWHNIAFSWKFDNPEKTEIALYIDGHLVKKIKKITLEIDDKKWQDAVSVNPDLNDWNSFKGHTFTFGAAWGSKGTKNARLGDLKIYNYVRSYEVQKSN